MASLARILVVEDEQNLAAGIRFNLELEGYEVEVVADGLDALAVLTEARPPVPAVVVFIHSAIFDCLRQLVVGSSPSLLPLVIPRVQLMTTWPDAGPQ